MHDSVPITQSKSIETLGENILKVADTVLKPHAEETVTKFTRILNLFSKYHHGYNSLIYMNDEKIKQLGMNIMFYSNYIGIPCTDADTINFMADYRPHSPKQQCYPKCTF